MLTISVGYSTLNDQQKGYSNNNALTVQEAKKFHTEQEKIALIHSPSTKPSIYVGQDDYVVDWESASVVSDDKISSVEVFVRGFEDYYIGSIIGTDVMVNSGLKVKLLILRNNITGRISQYLLYFIHNQGGGDEQFSLNKYYIYLGLLIITNVDNTNMSAHRLRGYVEDLHITNDCNEDAWRIVEIFDKKKGSVCQFSLWEEAQVNSIMFPDNDCIYLLEKINDKARKKGLVIK